MTTQLEPGDKAPDFALPSDAGSRLRLSDFRGRMVALYFYPKDDTSACTAEAIAFNGLRAKFDAAGVDIVGVSPNSTASHDKFKKKHKLKLALVSDETKTMLEHYGVWKEKSMYGRKYMGVERTTMLIDPQGAIARIWRKVKVPGHAQEVLDAARAL